MGRLGRLIDEGCHSRNSQVSDSVKHASTYRFEVFQRRHAVPITIAPELHRGGLGHPATRRGPPSQCTQLYSWARTLAQETSCLNRTSMIAGVDSSDVPSVVFWGVRGTRNSVCTENATKTGRVYAMPQPQRRIYTRQARPTGHVSVACDC